MVRISVDDRGAALHLKLEGRLVGAWVAELEQCWRSCSAQSSSRKLIVDLTDTESVDLAGKYLIRLMHHSGVAFTARTPYMKALVAEITGTNPGLAGPAVDLGPQGVNS